MQQIPNFTDIRRKKLEFFSPENVIRSKATTNLGPSSMAPLPSVTPTITPTNTPTPTPTTTPYQNYVVGSGTVEQVSTIVSEGYESSVFYFNNTAENFDVYGLGIRFNDSPAVSVTYAVNKENQYFRWYPGFGNTVYVGQFKNAFIYNFNS